MANVVEVTRDELGNYVVEMSDGTNEILECFNCGSKDISTVFLFLKEPSSAPRGFSAEGIAVKQFSSDPNWKDEHANGVCFDQECIYFSTCRISLNDEQTDVLT